MKSHKIIKIDQNFCRLKVTGAPVPHRLRSIQTPPLLSSFHKPAAASPSERLKGCLPDAAMLIGIAMQHAKRGAFRPGSVPDATMKSLCLHAMLGSSAARLVVDYLHRRAFRTIKASDGTIQLTAARDRREGGAT